MASFNYPSEFVFNDQSFENYPTSIKKPVNDRIIFIMGIKYEAIFVVKCSTMHEMVTR